VTKPVHFSQVHADEPPWRRRELGAGLCLMVPEAPFKQGPEHQGASLLGAPARKLAHLAGLTYPAGFAYFFDRVPVLECRPLAELGEPWPVVEAHRRGSEILCQVSDPNAWSDERPDARDVVVLGRRAWLALGFGEEAYFCRARFKEIRVEGEAVRKGSPRFWLLPNPERRTRLWRLPETEERVGELLRLLVAERRARGAKVQTVNPMHAGD
jgi:hypothetical protein